MSDKITIKQGKLVIDSSFVPYVRKQDVVFEAENLRPGKIARLFLDDIVMNQFSQRANKIQVNNKKVLTISANSGGSNPDTDDYVYQGTRTEPTFEANVKSYFSGNSTVVLNNLSGNFNSNGTLKFERSSSLIRTANITSITDLQTADIFLKNEGLVCTNSNVYMTVIGASGENLLYVNQNYLNANIQAISGNVLSSMTSDFVAGDIVFQTNSGARTINTATFVGRVEYYNPGESANVLAITYISGDFKTNSTAGNVQSRIWNATNATSKAVEARGAKDVDISANNILRSVSNSSNTVDVILHTHTSGSIQNTSLTVADSSGNLNVYVSSTQANSTLAVGNLIYFTAGSGIGQFIRIVEVDGKRIKLASAPTVMPDTSTKYSIGNHIVDDNGNLTGILNIPEESNFKFKVGERLFTITDADFISSTDYTMKASAKYVAGGIINKTTQVVTPKCLPLPDIQPSDPVSPVSPSERTFNPDPALKSGTIPKTRSGDPIAQTFFTPKPKSNKTNNGIFVSSIDLFFGNKPSVVRGSAQLPVTVKLATVINGFPTQNYIASKTVQAKDVKVSTSPNSADSSTITKFTFDDPVYLLPDSEYAIIVYTESPEYEVYVAQLGGEVLGATPPRRISEQPYSGSFFRAQNSSTWTPYNNQDLMFVVNKAVFASSGTVTLNLKDAPVFVQNVHRLFLHTNELNFQVCDIDYKVKGVLARTSALEPNYNSIKPHTVFRYGSLLDYSNKVSSTSYLNSRSIVYGNANSVIMEVNLSTSDSDVTPIFNKENFSLATSEYSINNAEMANTIISVTNRGTGYNATITAAAHTTSNLVVKGSNSPTLNNAAQLYREQHLANNFNVGFYAISISSGMGSNANGFAVANTTGANNVDYIVISEPGYGYIETPTITIVSGNATSTVTANATINGENGKSGGNILAKYITRQFTLEDGFESGDMRVWMDVIRPTGTDIQVYYKVLGAEDSSLFTDKPWVRMFKKTDKYSKDESEIIELEFRPDLLENVLQYTENGVMYPIGGKYKYFAIKVGLLSTDSTVIPVARNLRIVATPEG